MKKTRLLYLPEFDVVSGVATVVGCQQEHESCCLILDQTVFYPGGGGQPADAGELVFGETVMPVLSMEMTNDGIVAHRVASCPEGLGTGSSVRMKVDDDTRTQHNRLHSAGHVIDLAVHQLGFDWTPTKGAHFPAMSFVEYATETPLAEGTKERLQAQCDELVATGSTNTIQFLDTAGQPLTNPDLGHLEAERIVSYDGFGLGCGGTHVDDIAAIGKLIIKKTKKKKGVVKVSYTIEPL